MSSLSPFFELLSWWRAALGMDFATFYKFFFKRESASPQWRQAAKDKGLSDEQINLGLTAYDKTVILETVQDPHERELQVKDYNAAALKADEIEKQRIADAETQKAIEEEGQRQQEDYLKLDTAAQEQQMIAQVDYEKSLQARDEQAALAAYESRNQATQTSVVPQTAYVSPVVEPVTAGEAAEAAQISSAYDSYEARKQGITVPPPPPTALGGTPQE